MDRAGLSRISLVGPEWSSSDESVVDAVLRKTGIRDLADRTVDSLSGGQRQAPVELDLAEVSG